MALDRKIRIGLQVSELLADPSYEGEDVEVRQEMGRAELRKNFDMLVRGRDRPNGILGEGEELSAPDTLVKGTYFSDSDSLSLSMVLLPFCGARPPKIRREIPFHPRGLNIQKLNLPLTRVPAIFFLCRPFYSKSQRRSVP